MLIQQVQVVHNEARNWTHVCLVTVVCPNLSATYSQLTKSLVLVAVLCPDSRRFSSESLLINTYESLPACPASRKCKAAIQRSRRKRRHREIRRIHEEHRQSTTIPLSSSGVEVNARRTMVTMTTGRRLQSSREGFCGKVRDSAVLFFV